MIRFLSWSTGRRRNVDMTSMGHRCHGLDRFSRIFLRNIRKIRENLFNPWHLCPIEVTQRFDASSVFVSLIVKTLILNIRIELPGINILPSSKGVEP